MVVEARLRIRHRGCFTERLTGPSQGAQLASDRESDMFVLHGETPHVDAVLAQISASRPRPVEVVNRTATGAVVRCRGPSHAIGADIAAGGCTVQWPALFVNGEEIYNVLAPTKERLETTVAKLAAHGQVLVERVGEAAPGAVSVSVPLADITTALTERQLIVLQTAIAEGYYDSPRRTSTEALAATFGVTRSTLEEHLRKAERRVLEGFAGILTAQPVLASAATRRPGRPAARVLR